MARCCLGSVPLSTTGRLPLLAPRICPRNLWRCTASPALSSPVQHGLFTRRRPGRTRNEKMIPVRLNRHVMYDYLLMFTVLVVLVQVTYILEPDCSTSNSRFIESTQGIYEGRLSGNEHNIEWGKIASEKVESGAKPGHEKDRFPRAPQGRVQDKKRPSRKGDRTKDKRDAKSEKHKAESRSISKQTVSGNKQGARGNNAAGATGGRLRDNRAKQALNRTQNSVKAPALSKQNKTGHDFNVGRNDLHNDTKSLSTGARNKDNKELSSRFEGKTRLKSNRSGNETSVKADDEANECRRSILVYGGVKVIRQWAELSTFVAALTLQDDGDWSARVSCDECAVQLILSSRVDHLRGKDAVVFGMSPFSLKVKMKTFRKYNFDSTQLLVFYGVETPLRMRKWVPYVGELPNHVMWSYASTADIRLPYGYYKAGTPQDAASKKIPDALTAKRKLIAWMGSNCEQEVFWPRMDFIRKLQAHVPVDVYGKCGNLTCLPRMSQRCENLMSEYKFYLSLENAECDDYVTEKFWATALMHETVPVVYGAPKSYLVKIAPPNSFIYAGDFKTAKQLANYLLRLDRNPQEYAKYFDWHQRGTVIQNFPNLKLSHFCGILPYISKASEGRLGRRRLSEAPWFNSCRKMRKGAKAFLPNNVKSKTWVPW